MTEYNERFKIKADILIVDGESGMLRTAERILTGVGCRCRSAANVPAAERLLQNCASFDLMICEIGKPAVSSGLNLLAKARSAHPDTAFVAVTDIDQVRTADLFFKAGAYGYLLEHFTKSELLIQVAGALQRRTWEMNSRTQIERLQRESAQKDAELLQAHSALERKEAIMQIQSKKLKDLDTALRVVLEKKEVLKDERHEDHVSMMLKEIVPYLRKIFGAAIAEKRAADMPSMENVMVSSTMKNNQPLHARLTPAEVEVAQLIKQGKRTKEIADQLNLSMNTIFTHRYRIRKKLGLLGKNKSIQSALFELHYHGDSGQS